MTLNVAGLLLTAALVIAVRLGDAWAYRRRVARRLGARLGARPYSCHKPAVPWGQ